MRPCQWELDACPPIARRVASQMMWTRDVPIVNPLGYIAEHVIHAGVVLAENIDGGVPGPRIGCIQGVDSFPL